MERVNHMHDLTELPPWDRLMKRIVWAQIGDVKGKHILDFGSGTGITADRYAAVNDVVAVEPSDAMLQGAWRDHPYAQIAGDVSALASFEDASFDLVFCHNVLEYIDDKEAVLRELCRVLKKSGTLSVVKHNRPGRVMQMAVLLDDFDRANALLDGKTSASANFGEIRYYDDGDVLRWCPELALTDCFGVRTFWDLQQNQEKHADEEWQKQMAALEMRVSQIDAYRNIAFFHHLILKKEETD